MIKNFNITEKVVYPLHGRLRKFIGDLRRLGYPNPFNPEEIVIDDIMGVEVKIDLDVVWITNIHMLDKRKKKAADIIKEIFELAKENDITIGIIPFPAQEAGLNQEDLVYWFSNLGFVRVEGKYIRSPL